MGTGPPALVRNSSQQFAAVRASSRQFALVVTAVAVKPANRTPENLAL
jgi:hypothetical protein